MKAVPICAGLEISKALRLIADDFDSGAFVNVGCTVIVGNAVYGLGYVHKDQAMLNIIWDCNYAISALMRHAVEPIADA